MYFDENNVLVEKPSAEKEKKILKEKEEIKSLQ